MSAQVHLKSFIPTEKKVKTQLSQIPNEDTLDDIECGLIDLDAIKQEEEYLLSFMGAAQRKRQGVFFTPDELAKLAVSKMDSLSTNCAIFDPACGTGNLLVEVADRFDASGSLSDCLVRWNKKIYGLDINQEFICLAKKKIVCLAISKGALPTGGITLAEALLLLSNIKVGDFLVEYQSYKGVVSDVVMNPPFCPVDTPAGIKWTSGKSNAAALFMAYAINILPIGGRVLGILPDVLKSGSRYEAWRREVVTPVNPIVEDFGSFQKDVQIDVFILSGVKTLDVTSTVIGTINESPVNCQILADEFHVSVGPVVPHRDPLIGVEAPFAHAKILPPWSTVSTLAERIVHSGRKISCPFVAVRRTSSPKDKYRVVGTIINCEEAVAVENHIIAVRPNNGTLEACISLLDYFKSSAVNDYINTKIRCRHLTVGVIKGLPIGGLHEHKE